MKKKGCCDSCGARVVDKIRWDGTVVHGGKSFTFTLCRECFDQYPVVIRGRAA